MDLIQEVQSSELCCDLRFKLILILLESFILWDLKSVKLRNDRLHLSLTDLHSEC